VSTITCNKEIKGNPNVKILVLSHALGDLGVTHRVHLWFDGKRTDTRRRLIPAHN